ncbi:MAG: hypothetical protein WBA46_01270 [Thermomicrobiales bacterium]
MTNLHHPLTPWTPAQCRALVIAQIDRNRTERDLKIIAAYCSGLSAYKVSRLFDTSASAVLKIIRRHDPSLVRPTGRPPRKGGDAKP